MSSPLIVHWTPGSATSDVEVDPRLGVSGLPGLSVLGPGRKLLQLAGAAAFPVAFDPRVSPMLEESAVLGATRKPAMTRFEQRLPHGLRRQSQPGPLPH